MYGAGLSPEDVCTICLDDGPDKRGVPQEQICPNGHYTHPRCFVEYIVHHKNTQIMQCPECRTDLSDFMVENQELFKPLFKKALKKTDPAAYKFTKAEEKRIENEIKQREERMKKLRTMKFFKTKK